MAWLADAGCGQYWQYAAGNKFFMNRSSRDIRSCYYHIAKTDKESLFFISDAIPITKKYIERSYDVGDTAYVIRNKKTIAELQRKLTRILAYESRNPNSFRQHITDVKKYLLQELGNQPK